MDIREENWESFRSKIFEELVVYSTIPFDYVCCLCGSDTPRVRCHQCSVSQYMCAICDEQVHKQQLMHDREVLCDGVLKAVPPTSFLSSEGGLKTEKVNIPINIPWKCPCCKKGKLSIRSKASKKILLNLRGHFDLSDAFFVCDVCGDLEIPHDIVRRYWPGSPSRKSVYMIDPDLFLFYDLLKKHNPGLSEVGFLRSLEQFSLSKGRIS